MEECVRLVCETLCVHTVDEVSVEKIADLYQKVFHTSTELRDVQRAVTQVSAQNGDLPCSGRWILHVLLEMEKEREKREKLFWELQMLKSGLSGVSDRVDTHTLSRNSSGHKNRNTKPCSLSSLLGRARRLYVRLDVDGVWSLLPSLSHSHVTSRRLGLISPTKSDVLLLLEYKYDIIRERLYREMLQEEHGVGCWELMEPSEQTDCVCDLEQRAEEALNLSDALCVCELPGVLHCYRRADQVKVREQAWTSAIFLSELRSHCDEERRSLTQLLNRVERFVLTEIYLSVCVSVRRAERETHSHTALLTSRQHWDNWPCLRRLDVEDLVKFWLQEKQDPVTQLRNEFRTSRCVQQAVLQCVVQCQEQERRMLVEILHTVSQEELQELRHTLTPDSRTTGWTLRQGCVSVLKQIKSSLQSSSTHSTALWDDCTVYLLAQLTHTHDQEIQTVIHTLPVMDAAALLVLLQKYELELCSPKLHNLHILLQTSSSETTQSNIPVTVKERERREEEEEERTEGREGEEEMREERERKVGEKEKRREQREIEEEERREGREGEEEWKVDAVEKQASLITLAWSKPANNNTQEVTSALPEAPTTDVTSTESHTPDHTHSASSLCEHTATAHTHTLVEPIQEPNSSSTVLRNESFLTFFQDVQNDISSDEHRTSSAAAAAVVQVDSESTPASGETHTQDAVCDAVCEEQQLQREATMRSLVHIQRRAEQRWQRDRDRQILRVQERLSIIQNRKSDEDLLGLRREETFRHLTNTLQQEDEQQQKMMVRVKLQQMWRERSYVLQSRRERNTTEFKELLTPTAQCVSNAEDVLDSHTCGTFPESL
ncbi:hypothetical protein KOW79_003013 [Hemibagrus wyckioides]|uniref:Uncharacterized protein n=1 Tax=Hemibagrus wyckioides TaxID=337641 RepID=A0A9D3P4P4_9TELE|nr:hypothetical protein KOW79_003013 [Hemibagrus wyckioides]